MEGELTSYRNSSHTVRVFEAVQCLRKDKVLCDIKLETDDGTIIYAHKVILASASQYFYSMFTNFEERTKDRVIIKELDSVALTLLVDFIYTAEVVITEDNLQVLLHAANLLQLHNVQDACCDFLKTQLHPSNCLGIKALADLHDCVELLSITKTYIQQHFLEVIEGDEFLSLSLKEVVELISSDELIVPSEEKVFECVISWVNYNLDNRKDVLPKLMEHVRLPFASREYLLKIVKEEPLLKNSSKCKDYIIEALDFHLLKSVQSDIIPKTIRTKPRLPAGLPKVILVIGGFSRNSIGSEEWYDPATNQWHFGLKIINLRYGIGYAVMNDCRVFAVGGRIGFIRLCDVEVMDISSSSPCWVPTVSMLTPRSSHGVAVLNNSIYAVGGYSNSCLLNSAEMFDCSTQEWKMISNMYTRRIEVGVGVLNDLLYVVGGYDGISTLKSVECYHPSTNRWTPAPEMSIYRSNVGVAVLDGVLYAVGGENQSVVYKSVEAYTPSAGVWTLVSDMHVCRSGAGVVALDGLLYVVGGYDGKTRLASAEVYNPNTNTWSILTSSMNVSRSLAGVFVIDKPQ